ncbi:MAG: hypothetical protein ISP90_02950 [Nevskia sp.]|nr:hypothetical protein [Nevskia sp.]
MASTANKAIKEFKGQVGELESAIGTMFVAEQVGWKPIYLIHDKKTIRKYEKILGINFRDEFDDEGPLVHKSLAYTWAKELGNFWKRVKGEITGARSPQLVK